MNWLNALDQSDFSEWVWCIIILFIKFSTSDNAFRVLCLVHSILVISSYTWVWLYMVNDCAKRCYKLKMFSPESKIFLWMKPKMKKKLFCGKFGSMPTFRTTRKGKKCLLWWCLSDHKVLHNIASSSSFFAISLGFSHYFCSYFKLLEFKELNETIIPFAVVGYETGYSQLISNARSWNIC